MTVVSDAGVLISALSEKGGPGARARERLHRAGLLHAPHVVDLEVASALRGLVRAAKVSTADAEDALVDLAVMRLHRHSHRGLLRRSWALRENLTIYDASYVALAEALSLVLVTTDARLATASGVRCEVEVLEA